MKHTIFLPCIFQLQFIICVTISWYVYPYGDTTIITARGECSSPTASWILKSSTCSLSPPHDGVHFNNQRWVLQFLVCTRTTPTKQKYSQVFKLPHFWLSARHFLMPAYRNSTYAFIYLAVDPRPGRWPWPQWGLPAWAWDQARTRPGTGPRAAPTEAMGLGRARGPPPNI
jgi:hypothetical protein